MSLEEMFYLLKCLLRHKDLVEMRRLQSVWTGVVVVAGQIIRLREELCGQQTQTRQALILQDRLVGRARELTARAAQYRAQVSTQVNIMRYFHFSEYISDVCNCNNCLSRFSILTER